MSVIRSLAFIFLVNSAFSQTDVIKPRYFSIQPTDSATFSHLKFNPRSTIFLDTTPIPKVGRELKLPLKRKWNRYAVFNDSISELEDPNESPYRYHGKYASLGVYLVEEQLYEYEQFHLIEDQEGGITTTWNFPVFSPDSAHFANISLDYGLDGLPNGIQIWKVNKWFTSGIVEQHVSIENVFELDQQFWIPIDFVWENEHSIILKVETLSGWADNKLSEESDSLYYLRLTF